MQSNVAASGRSIKQYAINLCTEVSADKKVKLELIQIDRF